MTAVFYLGTHETSWLHRQDVNVPLFVSAVRLRKGRNGLRRRSTHRWALDSGGFTELGRHGGWTISPERYAEETHYWSTQIGSLDWAAPQDWMCEPSMLAETGKTVAEHQSLTIENYLRLTELGGPFIPVIQGWEFEDYHRHVDQYADAGIDLASSETVGVGSVCRRGQDDEITHILKSLADRGIRCHGFGVRSRAFRRCESFLASADSMAWSFNARKNPPLDGCTHKHCNNCERWALCWRDRQVVAPTVRTDEARGR